MTELAAAIAVAGAALAAAFATKQLSKTIESMTRQPEMSNELRSTMFIVALIEGCQSSPLIALSLYSQQSNKRNYCRAKEG